MKTTIDHIVQTCKFTLSKTQIQRVKICRLQFNLHESLKLREPLLLLEVALVAVL